MILMSVRLLSWDLMLGAATYLNFANSLPVLLTGSYDKY